MLKNIDMKANFEYYSLLGQLSSFFAKIYATITQRCRHDYASNYYYLDAAMKPKECLVNQY